MKKAMSRIIHSVNSLKIDNIYLLSTNSILSDMYIKHIKKYLPDHKIIKLDNKRIHQIDTEKNNLIILCNRWYLNRIAQQDGFNKFIEHYFTISIPFDEIE